MPDSLVGGFDTAYINNLNTVMDNDARGQLNIHKTAGTLFPLIFGFTWLLLIGTNVARSALTVAGWVLLVLSLLAGALAVATRGHLMPARRPSLGQK